MAIGLQRTKSGLLIPAHKPVGVQCGFCPTIIFRHNEAKGRLFMLQGKPICAKCRILKFSKFSKQIRRDKKIFKKDMEFKERMVQDLANQKVEQLAKITQAATKVYKH